MGRQRPAQDLPGTKPEVFVSFAAQKVDAEAGRIKNEATRGVISSQLGVFAGFIDDLR